MAIRIQNNNTEMILTIDNGDRQAIFDVMEKYRFISEEALLRFALVVLLRNEKNGVYIEENNQRVFMAPSPSIIIQDQPEQPSVTSVEPITNINS